MKARSSFPLAKALARSGEWSLEMVTSMLGSSSLRAFMALGFLTFLVMDWLPKAMNVLRDELPSIDVTISSDHSPNLAGALARGKLDLAFMRPEPQMPDLEYKVVATQPLIVVLPSDHRLASHETIALKELAGETYLGISDTAPTLQAVIDNHLKRSGIDLRPAQRLDNLAMAMSLIASTRGVALLPAYARNFLPWSVVSRPLEGKPPTIDLVIGYNTANTSPILKLFLSKSDQVISRVSSKLRSAASAPA